MSERFVENIDENIPEDLSVEPASFAEKDQPEKIGKFLKLGKNLRALAGVAVMSLAIPTDAEAGEKPNNKSELKTSVTAPLGYRDDQLKKMGYSDGQIEQVRKDFKRTPPLGYTSEQLKKLPEKYTEEEINRALGPEKKN